MNSEKITSFEKIFIEDLRKILHSEMVFIDVGANTGTYVYLVNNLINKSSIYAIESSPSKFDRLKEDCCQWERESDNKIHLLQITIGNREEQVDLETTDTFKLDTLFKAIKPDLIKIDANDRELEIIQGCREILKAGKTKFLISLSSQMDELSNFMKSFNYYPVNFHEMLLFSNPKSQPKFQLSKTFKSIGRKIIPLHFQYWFRSLIHK